MGPLDGGHSGGHQPLGSGTPLLPQPRAPSPSREGARDLPEPGLFQGSAWEPQRVAVRAGVEGLGAPGGTVLISHTTGASKPPGSPPHSVTSVSGFIIGFEISATGSFTQNPFV